MTEPESGMWLLDDGTVLINVHQPDKCEGAPCWVHHPSDHHMVDWPKRRRGSGLLERTCEHGIGHPDPDSLWFFDNVMHLRGYEVHGCDGCCSPPE